MLLGHGQPAEATCLRRYLAAWAVELTGGDPPPPPAATAKVAWLAVRYAEADLLAAPVARRPAADGRLTSASQ